MAEDGWEPSSDPLMAALRQMVHELFDVPMDQIGPGFDLVEEVAADSLELVEVLVETERRFDVDLPDNSNIRTLEDLRNVLADSLSRRSG